MAGEFTTNRMVVAIGEPQRTARLHLALVDGHNAAPDDLGYIGAGVDAEGQHGNANLVSGAGKDNEVHNQQLNHNRRAADHSGVDLADDIQNTQNRVMLSGTLLIVAGTNHGPPGRPE